MVGKVPSVSGDAVTCVYSIMLAITRGWTISITSQAAK